MTRLASLLPGDAVTDRYQRLEDLQNSAQDCALILYHTSRLQEAEGSKVELFLLQAPGRLVVLCDSADPSQVFRLTKVGVPFGLISIESDRPSEHLAERLTAWYWGGIVTPDWDALGAPPGESPPLIRQVMAMIQRDPFHDWRVREIAGHLRVSERTLNREMHEYFGTNPKALLMKLRYQLITRLRSVRGSSWKELAPLFGFESAKEMYTWYRKYEKRRSWL